MTLVEYTRHDIHFIDYMETRNQVYPAPGKHTISGLRSTAAELPQRVLTLYFTEQ
jgi:hypothetical protein